jgi:hypothetical protein
MTLREMSAQLDKVGYVEFDCVHVEVEIVDVKEAYGSLRFLVRPVAGRGTKWCSADRFKEKV